MLSATVILNLAGENNVIQNAKDAVDTSNKQTATEKMNLKLTTIQMDSYTEKQRLPTLQEVANILSNDGEVFSVDIQSQFKNNGTNEVASLSADINIGESKSIFVILNEFPYEFEINDSLQLASIDGVDLIADNNTNDETVTITREQYDELISRISNLEKSSQSEYKPGDTITYPMRVSTSGWISNSKKSLYFSFSLDKKISNEVSKINFSTTGFNIRHVNGGYLINSGTTTEGANISDYFSVGGFSNNMITFYYNSTTAFNTTNNTPLSFEFVNLVIRFE